MSELLELMMNWKEMIENFKDYLKKINDAFKSVLEGAEIYIFGSALEGKQVGGSDIDVLIVAEVPRKHLKRAEIIAEIEEKAGLPLAHPFEIHLIDPSQFNTWKDIYNLNYKDLDEFLEL